MRDFSAWLHAYDAYTEWDFAHRQPFPIILVSSLFVFFVIIAAAAVVSRKPASGHKMLSAFVSIGFALDVFLYGFVTIPRLVNYSKPEPIKPYSLGRQVSDEWGLSDIDCDADLDIHRLPRKDLRCTVDKDGRTIRVTLHVDGSRIGLYDERGKALE